MGIICLLNFTGVSFMRLAYRPWQGYKSIPTARATVDLAVTFDYSNLNQTQRSSDASISVAL